MTTELEQDQPPIPQQAVAARAYDLYCARGCEDGHDLDYWFEAEAQIREEAGMAKSQPVAATPTKQ